MRSYLRETLAAILIVSGCGSGEAGPDAGDWRFNADTVRSADGSFRQTSFLRVVGQEGPEGEPRTRPVILSFDCLPDNAGSTIMTDQALRQGSVETRLTVDSSPPLRLPAFAGTTPSGGQVVLTVPQDSLLALLSGHQRAVIEYADGAGSSRTTAEFRLTGLGVYQAPFQKACAERGG
ncbi:MAG: hypothetical protein H0X69_15910 [Gemmatimonadales bacterium]|nr:hypothetical protein [Gemmatimonadales bacterium]